MYTSLKVLPLFRDFLYNFPPHVNLRISKPHASFMQFNHRHLGPRTCKSLLFQRHLQCSPSISSFFFILWGLLSFSVLWVLYLKRCCYILFCNSMSFVIGDFLDYVLCHINRNGSLLVLHTRKFHLWYTEKIIVKIYFSLTVFAFFKDYSNRNLRISLRFLFVFFISRLNF